MIGNNIVRRIVKRVRIIADCILRHLPLVIACFVEERELPSMVSW